VTSMASPVSPLTAGSLAQLTLSLLAIVGLIFALSWLMKRLKFSGPHASGDMAVLDSLSVGPRERIALIRVGDAQVLVGISAAGIVALAPLSQPIGIAPAARPPAFAERLRELMKRPGAAS
jgi:flagellar protein FliO/FliZ